MPCYQGWDYAPVGTPQFEAAKATITPKWERFKHVIDCYYRVEQVRLPAPAEFRMIEPAINTAWVEAMNGTFSKPAAEAPSLDDQVFGTSTSTRSLHKKLLHRITLHLACDGAGFADAWDVGTWLHYESESTRDPQMVGYWHIVAWIGLGLRTGMLLGADRPKPWRQPTNVPDATVRASQWFNGVSDWNK